jgi:hypothetical protein
VPAERELAPMSDPPIRGYRLSQQYQADLAHIERVAGLAAQIVSRYMRVQIDRTEVVVTTSGSASDLMIEAHRSMFGRQPSIWKLKSTPKHLCGIATITKAGVLVIVNADRCQSKAELNTTLVHEVVHAAQLSRPGARDVATRNLRNNYGIDRMNGREARAANRSVEADEREAEKLEHLASGLPA